MSASWTASRASNQVWRLERGRRVTDIALTRKPILSRRNLRVFYLRNPAADLNESDDDLTEDDHDSDEDTDEN
jgi:hypothetical protein